MVAQVYYSCFFCIILLQIAIVQIQSFRCNIHHRRLSPEILRVKKPYHNKVAPFQRESIERYAVKDSAEILEERSSPRVLYFALWASFLGFAFLFAPGGDYYSTINPLAIEQGVTSASVAATDNVLLQKLISTPFDGQTNALFVAIFNALGILPATYSGLLLPGASKQSKVLPTALFSALSFAMGFGALGPYLALRRISTSVTSESKPSIVENKVLWVPAIGFALFLLYFLCRQSFGDATTNVVGDFVELCSHSRLALASTIDFAILSLAVREYLFPSFSLSIKAY